MTNRPRLMPLLAALFALLSQLALGMAPATARPDAQAAIHICGAPGQHQAPDHQAPACHLCPLCFSTTHAVPLLPPGPAEALPARWAGRACHTPFQPRAPPAHAVTAAYPRGPPALA